MAEPIQFTVGRDVHEELRHKVEDAPIDHAEAVLAVYELLQEAQDHGVLDTLRGVIGAGETLIGKASEYANTPEGIRLMRNLLATVRLLGELDPGMLDAAAKAFSEIRHEAEGKGSESPSILQIFRRLTGPDSRRTAGMLAGFSAVFGREHRASGVDATRATAKRFSRPQNIAPVIAVALGAIVASYWIGRHSSR